MTNLITISVANDACAHNLRVALALAAHLRRLGCKVEVVVEGWQDDDWACVPLAA